MEGINNKIVRSPEELKKADALGQYFKQQVHKQGGVDSERDRIDILVQQFKDGTLKTLEDLDHAGEFLIQSRQGNH